VAIAVILGQVALHDLDARVAPAEQHHPGSTSIRCTGRRQERNAVPDSRRSCRLEAFARQLRQQPALIDTTGVIAGAIAKPPGETAIEAGRPRPRMQLVDPHAPVKLSPQQLKVIKECGADANMAVRSRARKVKLFIVWVLRNVSGVVSTLRLWPTPTHPSITAAGVTNSRRWTNGRDS
jgi:hypothetical protein